MQATIWRIPPGGGNPQIWFQDSRFASPYIGVNGLRLNPKATRVFLTVSLDLQGRASVYSLPLVAKPAPSQMTLFHAFGAGELPDGIAFGKKGDLYVAIASPLAAGVLDRRHRCRGQGRPAVRARLRAALDPGRDRYARSDRRVAFIRFLRSSALSMRSVYLSS
jgi:hypothetical protein